jgi:hypothetical protein
MRDITIGLDTFNPFSFRTKLSFIVKQPACAAAMISSRGVISMPASKAIVHVIESTTLGTHRSGSIFSGVFPNSYCIPYHLELFSKFKLPVREEYLNRLLQH